MSSENESFKFESSENLEYPDFLVCIVFPQLDPEETKVEIMDWDKNKMILGVPSQYVYLLNVSNSFRNASNTVKSVMAHAIGLGLVSCKIIKYNEDVVSVDIPCKDIPLRIVVDNIQIVKKNSSIPHRI